MGPRTKFCAFRRVQLSAIAERPLRVWNCLAHAKARSTEVKRRVAPHDHCMLANQRSLALTIRFAAPTRGGGCISPMLFEVASKWCRTFPTICFVDRLFASAKTDFPSASFKDPREPSKTSACDNRQSAAGRRDGTSNSSFLRLVVCTRQLETRLCTRSV